MIELQFYPEYIRDNPYIELFYKALEPYGVHARDGLLIGSGFLPEQTARLDAIQFHWCPERIWRGEEPPRLRYFRHVARLAKYLYLARRSGLRILWTVHDLVHHDHSQRSILDLAGYRVLARAADLCICHTEAVRRDVVRHFWAPPHKTVVMAHGNYDGIYPKPRPRAQTLASLRLVPTAKTLLCVGMIRPYKGIELALDTLRLLGDGFQLVIAGIPHRDAYGAALREHARGLPNVRMVLERIDQQCLADFAHAADCVLLPYRQVTGSGVLLTSLTLGRGVVVSNLPFFREVLDRDPTAGVVCASTRTEDTARAIREFFSIPVESRHAAARRIADEYAWAKVIQPVADWFLQTFPAKARAAVPAL
jgi:glycosyltransferase involved in cell wall biosynthesis